MLVALVALGVLALAAATFIGIGIDAQRWREPVAAALSRALGREVRLEGHARLTLSLTPAIVVGDIRIANPPGFDAPEFARIGEMRLVIGLLPLLWGEIQAGEAFGRNVTVSLRRSGDGRGNWVFDITTARGPFTFTRGGAYRLALEDVRIDYADG